MQESFSRSSVSCLINANLHSEFEEWTAEDRKRNPCWQVTQQLHFHIEKVLIYSLCPDLHNSVWKRKQTQIWCKVHLVFKEKNTGHPRPISLLTVIRDPLVLHMQLLRRHRLKLEKRSNTDSAKRGKPLLQVHT